MATTGTRSYDPTAATIITDALRMLGVIEEGGSATSTQITDCMPAFEMYIKGLSKYGLNLWVINNSGETISLTASLATYNTNNKALRMHEVIFRDSSGNDTVLTALSREEYWSLADKDDTSSQPTQYMFVADDGTANSTIYLWPVPDATAATGSLRVVYSTYIQDVDDASPDGSYTLNVPKEWFETIKYGLATRLAPMYGYPVQERSLLIQEYQLLLRESLEWDTEYTSIFLRPEC